ncbi:MAG: hypothetical protein ACR2PL_05870 [Dehalococcoidia bacterium]
MPRLLRRDGEDLALVVPIEAQFTGQSAPGSNTFRISRPSAEELACRKTAVRKALAIRAQTPTIAPLTTVDLVRLTREDDASSNEPGA